MLHCGLSYFLLLVETFGYVGMALSSSNNFKSCICALVMIIGVAGNAQPFPFVEDLSSVLVQDVEPSTSILWSDYDDDGHIDLLVGNAFAQDDLFHNEGSGVFTRVSLNAIPFKSMNSGTWADINGDQKVDLIVTSLIGNAVLINTGIGDTPFAYFPTTIDNVSNVRDAIVADFDNDGMLDLVLVRRNGIVNQYYRNTDAGFVLDPSNAVSQDLDDSTGGCWADVDNDGSFELYVTNSTGESNRYYDNEDGELVGLNLPPITDHTDLAQGCNWADYDNDGDFDLFVAGAPMSLLFQNQSGDFVDVSLEVIGSRGANSQGSAWGDVDNDGDLDLVITKRDAKNVLFLNIGEGTFNSVFFGSPADGWSTSATLVDDDEDGDLDLYIVNGNSDVNQRNQLFRNTTNGQGNWLEVDLRSTTVGRQGVGARVYAHAVVDGQPIVQMREVHTRTGRLAQGAARVHFGFGDATNVDSLVVVWPLGERQVSYDVASNRIVEIIEPMPTDLRPDAPVSFEMRVGVYPNPTEGAITLELQGMQVGAVEITVFDMVGRRVRTLRDHVVSGAATQISWDGHGTNGERVASGVYLLCIRSGDWMKTVPVVIRR